MVANAESCVFAPGRGHQPFHTYIIPPIQMTNPYFPNIKVGYLPGGISMPINP